MKSFKTVHTELLKPCTHIVPDIETLSTKPNAMILSIGAVAIVNDQIVGEFYRNIDPTNFEDLGFEASASTVEWWNNPEREAARADLQDDQLPIKDALQEFAVWMFSVDAMNIWGYGSDFDVVILKNAFDKLGVEWPIDFWNHRCLRTLAATLGIKVDRKKGVHHNAFDDAVNQGKALIKCHKHMADIHLKLTGLNH